MDPLYVIDGSNYIFRAYYAVSPLYNSKGFPTNALLGFSRMILKLLKDKDVKNIAIAFDVKAKTFRHKIYSKYKANRSECPEDLVPQMPYFREISKAFGIKVLEEEGYEADDIIATLTTEAKKQAQKVVIVSADKDLTQLVDKDVLVWDPMRDVLYDEKGVFNKFGVKPAQMLDYLSLMGDSSDNVPGVKGIGPKSASSLINYFGSIYELVKRKEEIFSIRGLRGAKRIRTLIEENLDSLNMSRSLIALENKVPIALGLDTKKEFIFKGIKNELLEPLLEELEFNSFRDSISLIREKNESSNKIKVEKKYKLVTNENFKDFVKELSTYKEFSFDTETTSLDTVEAKLVGISISFKEDAAYYLPIFSSLKESSCLDLKGVISALNPIFQDKDVLKIGFNLKFDISILLNAGFKIDGPFFDSMLASYVLEPEGQRSRGLKALTKLLLGEEMTTFEEILQDKENISQVENEKILNYAAHDADASLKLYKIFNEKLGEDKDSCSLRYVFSKIEMPLVKVLSKMELTGIRVDIDFLNSLETEFLEEVKSLEKRIYSLANKEFNINSPKQLASVLFEDLNISTKGVKKTKTGYSTNASVLNKIINRHEIIKVLLEYREVFKLQSTYIASLKKLVKSKTRRVHSSFNQAITSTGRLSSSDPNLQNIPIKNPRGQRIRKVFVAGDKKVLVKADYSQIELRVLAHLSKDKGLSDAFLNNEDIHLKTAVDLFPDAESDIKYFRRLAKTINFGIIYGMGAFRLASSLGISQKEAKRYIDEYFLKYPGVLAYYDYLKNKIEEDGYVETLFGRRRYAKDIDTSGRDAMYVSRSLINAPIQGTAAEIVKIAMIKADSLIDSKWKDKANMILQVHDELVFEVNKDIKDEVTADLVKTMEQAVKLNVPLRVDYLINKSWG